jgi:hypothetical protein
MPNIITNHSHLTSQDFKMRFHFIYCMFMNICPNHQMHSVDVSMLAENCPHLEELGAKLEGGWYGQAGAMLPELVICRIRVGATETLHALLVHASHLEHLEVKSSVI